MIFGLSLFGGSADEVERQILYESNPVVFPQHTRAHHTVSAAATDFMSTALCHSARYRPSADALLAHPWLALTDPAAAAAAAASPVGSPSTATPSKSASLAPASPISSAEPPELSVKVRAAAAASASAPASPASASDDASPAAPSPTSPLTPAHRAYSSKGGATLKRAACVTTTSVGGFEGVPGDDDLVVVQSPTSVLQYMAELERRAAADGCATSGSDKAAPVVSSIGIVRERPTPGFLGSGSGSASPLRPQNSPVHRGGAEGAKSPRWFPSLRWGGGKREHATTASSTGTLLPASTASGHSSTLSHSSSNLSAYASTAYLPQATSSTVSGAPSGVLPSLSPSAGAGAGAASPLPIPGSALSAQPGRRNSGARRPNQSVSWKLPNGHGGVPGRSPRVIGGERSLGILAGDFSPELAEQLRAEYNSACGGGGDLPPLSPRRGAAVVAAARKGARSAPGDDVLQQARRGAVSRSVDGGPRVVPGVLAPRQASRRSALSRSLNSIVPLPMPEEAGSPTTPRGSLSPVSRYPSSPLPEPDMVLMGGDASFSAIGGDSVHSMLRGGGGGAQRKAAARPGAKPRKADTQQGVMSKVGRFFSRLVGPSQAPAVAVRP